MIRKVIKLILIILCMGSIFWLSSDTARSSSKKSNYLIVRVTESFYRRDLNAKEKKRIVNKYVKLVRKSAHFILYLLLGIFIISFLMEYMDLSWKSMLISLVIVFLYACSDEIHQLFIPGRSGEVFDVLIDTGGGFFSLMLYNCYYKIRSRLYE